MAAPHLAAALLMVWLSAAPSAAAPPPQRQAMPVQAAQSGMLQRIRQWLGLNPPIAVGGSRGGGDRRLCLLAPQVRLAGDSRAEALVPVDTPTLQAAEPLAEIRLQTPQGQILWRRQAASSQAIVGPIAWPVPPLQPGVPVVLHARPLGVSGGDAAEVVLQLSGSAAERAQQQAAMAASRNSPDGWLALIDAAISAEQRSLARALIFAAEAPASPSLLALRQALSTNPCS